MSGRWIKILMPLVVTLVVSGCSMSSEPYSRGGTGYRYVVEDSPERALATLKRWSNPEYIRCFLTPNTPYGHLVRTKSVVVTEHSITLAGDRVKEYTDVSFRPSSEVADIPFSTIHRIEKEIGFGTFEVILKTEGGRYKLRIFGGPTAFNRFVDALEMYLPYALM